MEIQDCLGIDVSKYSLDAFIHQSEQHGQFENSPKGYQALIKWLSDQSAYPLSQIRICFEHTGAYSIGLAIYLNDQGIGFTMESALRIKRSMGLARGKNDKVDAQRIANYAWMKKEKLIDTKLPAKNLLKLKAVLAKRQLLVRQRAAQKASLKSNYLELIGGFSELQKMHKKVIRQFDQHIDQLDKMIQQIIDEDEELGKLFRLVSSVKGVGPIVAANFLVATNAFKSFTDGRKFACFAGLAPFAHQSGTSLNSKSKVSHLANKQMKALINLAARSAIRSDPQLKAYYQARIEKGKSKMSTLNVIRNKIVHRVFAVVKRQTPYVVLDKHNY